VIERAPGRRRPLAAGPAGRAPAVSGRQLGLAKWKRDHASEAHVVVRLQAGNADRGLGRICSPASDLQATVDG
jgi:hypothetical protein